MSASPSPREVAERFLRCLPEGNWREVIEFYADDVVVEFPFGLLGPKRLEGKEVIRKLYSAYDEGATAQKIRIDNVVVYETTDPEVVIVEYDVDGHITNTGRTFQLPNIQVMRVRNGRIVFSKNYHNDFIRAVATGMTQQIIAAFTGEGADKSGK